MKTLARWYDINIFYTSSKLEQIQFTGELIRYKNLEELLSKFEILEKVKFEIRNNTITIKEILKRQRLHVTTSAPITNKVDIVY